MKRTETGDHSNERGLQPTLTPFDVTSLVVGCVVGAGIYVVSSLSAALMGPAMLVAWAIAGGMAGLIALRFAQCAAIVTQSGGPYAYAREAFGYFPGFLVGWMLYLAKLVIISVFPVALVSHLEFFVPDLGWLEGTVAKVVLVSLVTITNCFGARVTGKINDILAAVKLGPLFLLVLLGLILTFLSPSRAVANLTPFVPMGWNGLGEAIVLVYWAFAGFELAALPAAEVIDPRRTLPAAIVRGFLIVAVFYLAVNAAAVLSTPWHLLAGSTAPLALAMETVMFSLSLPWWWIGDVIIVAGAILSIASANESVAMATSRLSYAMAVDGYLPRRFARLHPKYQTPYVALGFQGLVTLAVSIVGNLTALISLSVFFLSLTYLVTVLSSLRLCQRTPERRLPLAGSRAVGLLALACSVCLLIQAQAVIMILGVGLIVVGVLIYAYLAPKRELTEMEASIRLEEQRIAELERMLLLGPVRLLQHVRTLLQAGSRRKE